MTDYYAGVIVGIFVTNLVWMMIGVTRERDYPSR